MVLVMIKGSNDLGLGVLTSMIWIDGFYLALFCIIALGLFETILVHTLIRMHKGVMAVSVDAVFRKLMPLCVYPCIMGSAFLMGLNMMGAAVFLSIGGISLFGGIAACLSYRRVMKIQISRQKAVDELVRLQIDDTPDDEQEDEFNAALRQCFTVFDLDKSGLLDRREALVDVSDPGRRLRAAS